MTYNPFDKSPLDTLTVEDLEKLIENKVAEGYYVEYKSQFVKNEKIGWSISSFANSYGGWYIVGVKDNEHNIATDICGFNLSDCSDPISKIREIVKSNIDPQPLFYSQVIELLEEKAVLVVYIPDSQDKPFICKNGRVYRRLADSSDPILEKDRYTLDKLYEEGKETTKKYRNFCRDERSHNTNNGWVKIFLSPYPQEIANNYKINTFTSEDLEKILDLSKQLIEHYSFKPLSLLGNMPFNSGQTSFKSLIFRQNNNCLKFNSLEFELFRNFQAKIFIPLEYLVPWQKDVFDNLSEPMKEAIETSYKSGMIAMQDVENESLLFFNAGKLYLSILNLVNFYQYLLKEQALVEQLETTIKLERVKRHLPFFDSSKWAEHINKFNQPINYKSVIYINKENDRGLLLNCNSNLPLSICTLVGNSFGIPLDLTINIVSESIAKHGKK